MRFGICAPVEMAGVLRDGGADFVEENVQNCLLPGTLKIVGPDVDFAKIRAYIGTVMRRAAVVGMKILVFGSAGARNVPEGFDRGRAGEQILEFVRMAAEAAAANGIVLVAEPLSRDESNIIHTIAEAMELV